MRDLALLEEITMRRNLDPTTSERKLQIASLLLILYALVAICWASMLISSNRATRMVAPASSQPDGLFAMFGGDTGRNPR